MKLVVLLTLFGVSFGLPQNIGLLRSDTTGPSPDGAYTFEFESEDGIKRQEGGEFKAPKTYAISGSYSYTAPDGTLVEVVYVADENGFKPTIVLGGARSSPTQPARVPEDPELSFGLPPVR